MCAFVIMVKWREPGKIVRICVSKPLSRPIPLQRAVARGLYHTQHPIAILVVYGHSLKREPEAEFLVKLRITRTEIRLYGAFGAGTDNYKRIITLCECPDKSGV